MGHLETIPPDLSPYGALLDRPDTPPAPEATPSATAGGHTGSTGERTERTGSDDGHPARTPVCVPDLRVACGHDRRRCDVAARIGCGASYAVPLVAERDTNASGEPAGTPPLRLGAALWLYDEPAEPVERQRHLVSLYTRYAGEHLVRLLELTRAREHARALARELLPTRLPQTAGARVAVRHLPGRRGAVAAMGRLRASLRAYAVMEGEDPVAVLSDLELLLRLTEPARTATALFAYAEPTRHRLVMAGAGHAPPLVVGSRRCEYVETSLSAPLGMLTCWEAPSVELRTEPGETVLLYTDGLLRRIGGPVDRAFARLHGAASTVPPALREDPQAVADHVVRTVLADSAAAAGAAGAGAEGDDVVVLAVRFG
jgi:hypothetical protein